MLFIIDLMGTFWIILTLLGPAYLSISKFYGVKSVLPFSKPSVTDHYEPFLLFRVITESLIMVFAWVNIKTMYQIWVNKGSHQNDLGIKNQR